MLEVKVSFVGNFQFLASLFINDFLLLSHVQNNSGLIHVYCTVATVALSGCALGKRYPPGFYGFCTAFF